MQRQCGIFTKDLQLGSVMFEGESVEIFRFDSASVVDDFERSGAKVFQANLDGGGGSVDRILQKLLQRRSQIQNYLVIAKMT